RVRHGGSSRRAGGLHDVSCRPHAGPRGEAVATGRGPTMAEEPNDNSTLPEVGRWGTQSPPGTSIDRYVILQPLGRGGTAAVYAAYDPELDRRVALKFLLPAATEGTDSNALQARLLLEARAMARISH